MQQPCHSTLFLAVYIISTHAALSGLPLYAACICLYRDNAPPLETECMPAMKVS